MKTPREVLLNQHRSVDPKLNRMWYNALAPRLTGNILWRELVWPCRHIWAGLACAWVLIIVLQIASLEPAAQVAGKSAPASREEIQALLEQRRMLTQLIEPFPEAEHRRKSVLPGPRSERCPQFLNT